MVAPDILYFISKLLYAYIWLIWQHLGEFPQHFSETFIIFLQSKIEYPSKLNIWSRDLTSIKTERNHCQLHFPSLHMKYTWKLAKYKRFLRNVRQFFFFFFFFFQNDFNTEKNIVSFWFIIVFNVPGMPMTNQDIQCAHRNISDRFGALIKIWRHFFDSEK